MEVYLIYNTVLVSNVQQSDLVTCMRVCYSYIYANIKLYIFNELNWTIYNIFIYKFVFTYILFRFSIIGYDKIWI